MTPDERWLPFAKLIFGFILLLLLAGLAMAIGLGKVEQQTSFGLQDILGGLLVLSGGFTQWCFSTGSNGVDSKSNSSQKENPHP